MKRIRIDTYQSESGPKFGISTKRSIFKRWKPYCGAMDDGVPVTFSSRYSAIECVARIWHITDFKLYNVYE